MQIDCSNIFTYKGQKSHIFKWVEGLTVKRLALYSAHYFTFTNWVLPHIIWRWIDCYRHGYWEVCWRNIPDLNFKMTLNAKPFQTRLYMCFNISSVLTENIKNMVFTLHSKSTGTCASVLVLSKVALCCMLQETCCQVQTELKQQCCCCSGFIQSIKRIVFFIQAPLRYLCKLVWWLATDLSFLDFLVFRLRACLDLHLKVHIKVFSGSRVQYLMQH